MRPIILCFGGLDPTGGAGIQADIEAIFQTGAKAMSIGCAITAQNTKRVYKIKPIAPKWIAWQSQYVLEEFDISAIKIGMCANKTVVKTIAKIVKTLPQVPMILDPIITSGMGDDLGGTELALAIRKYLLPLSTVITPNMIELQKLSSAEVLENKIADIKNTGCKNILLTATDSSGSKSKVTHYWFGKEQKSFTYPKISGAYHGSGCTLAASLSSFIGQKIPCKKAAKMALNYTWRTIDKSCIMGRQQQLPERKV